MDGTHLFNKSNSDVMGIVFEHQDMHYLAQGAMAFFSKLVDFHVTYSNLNYIQRNDFRHMKNLKIITLNNNNIERIPEDSFIDVTKLEFLSISFNQIKSLPSNIFHTLSALKGIYLNNNHLEEISHLVFKFNVNVDEVWLQENKLKFISKNFTSNLTKLVQIYLAGNECIDQNYTAFTPSKIQLFTTDIANNCYSDCEPEIVKVSKCHEKYFELAKENEHLKKEILKLRNFMRSNLIV